MVDERTSILKIESPAEPDGFSWWAILSWRAEGEVYLSIARIVRDADGRVNTANPVTEPGVLLRLDAARAISIGILRVLYDWMPDSWGMLYPQDDPLEAYAVLAEACRVASPLRDEADPLRNLFALSAHYRRALRLVGKSRKIAQGWKARYTHAAEWARRNHKRVIAQRRELRKMQPQNLDFMGPLAARKSARALGHEPNQQQEENET